MPKLTKRGKIWHYSFTVDGERHRGSTGTSDRRLAEDIAAKADGAARRAATHGAETVLTFGHAVKEYIDDGKDTRFTAKLISHFSGRLIKDITGPEIRKAARILYPNASPATLNRQVITPMRAILNHAADRHRMQKIIVTRFKEDRKARPAGTRGWIDTFCKKAKALGMQETAAMARFMFETAARVSEACRLTWEDVNLQEGWAYLARTKTGPRKVFLTRALVVDLGNIRNRGDGPVFRAANRSTVKKRFDKVITAAGLARLTSHELGRHGFATEMIVRNDVDIATTAKHGGWKSARLLMDVYVEGDGDREVIEKVFGGRKAKRTE